MVRWPAINSPLGLRILLINPLSCLTSILHIVLVPSRACRWLHSIFSMPWQDFSNLTDPIDDLFLWGFGSLQSHLGALGVR